MSLMGVLMLIGIADSNSILIVDFAHSWKGKGSRWKMRLSPPAAYACARF